MNDIRRTILWVIFGFSMVLLWDQWQVYNGHKATFFPTPASQTATLQAASNATGAASVPSAVVAPLASAASLPVTASQSQASKEKVEILTDVLKLTFDTEGGTLSRAELRKHIDVHHPSQNEVLLDDSKDRVYLAQTGLIASASGTVFPTHKTIMTLRPGPRKLEAQDKDLSVVF